MHQLIAFLLISLLSLQAAVAAAGSACLHQRDWSDRHVGHHAHEHRSSSVERATAVAGDLDDHDCTSCQANALAAMPIDPRLPALPAAVSPAADAAAIPLSSAPPWRPERPNWLGTA